MPNRFCSPIWPESEVYSMKTLLRDESDRKLQSSGTKVIYFKVQGRKCKMDHNSGTKGDFFPIGYNKDSRSFPV